MPADLGLCHLAVVTPGLHHLSTRLTHCTLLLLVVPHASPTIRNTCSTTSMHHHLHATNSLLVMPLLNIQSNFLYPQISHEETLNRTFSVWGGHSCFFPGNSHVALPGNTCANIPPIFDLLLHFLVFPYVLPIHSFPYYPYLLYHTSVIYCPLFFGKVN